MHTQQLDGLKRWFDDYTRPFLTGDAGIDRPLCLKIEHTDRVCANIRRIARSIDLPPEQINTAEAVGLLHDIGRFEQYRRFRSFNDRKTANHALLGATVIASCRLLTAIDAHESRQIIQAIRLHNVRALPNSGWDQSLLFAYLIRDADKLDIWKVFADCFQAPEAPHPTVTLNLPERPEWSQRIVAAILSERMAKIDDMRSLNDFKLLQLGWIFDLNFPATVRLAKQNGDLAAIARSLPRSPEIDRAVAIVMRRLSRPAGANPSSQEARRDHT